MTVLDFEAVTKTFKSSIRGRRLYTLGPISFGVKESEIFGYLGPNGAGKTTTIKIALGLLKPTSGKVTCFGFPGGAAEARRRMGFLPEQPYFYQHLTGRELLEFYGNMFGLRQAESRRRAEHLLELVGLGSFGDTAISRFSKGMLQRIGLAQAIVNDPDLVVLDEPLTGLDPAGRREMRDLIVDLKSRGKTVFFSSHILQDVEMICDRVGILAEGRILKIASVSEVLEKSVRWIEVEVNGLSAEAARGLGLIGLEVAGDKAVIRVAEGDDLNRAIARLMSAGARISSVVPMRLTLEDYFLSQVDQERPGKRATGPAKDPHGNGSADPREDNHWRSLCPLPEGDGRSAVHDRTVDESASSPLRRGTGWK